MMLLTKTIRAKLPQLYAQDKNPDPVVWVKFFCPWNQWTWLATEGSGMAHVKPSKGPSRRAIDEEREILCELWQNTKGRTFPFSATGNEIGLPPGIYTLEDFHFFGYVHGLEDELGYFSLREMKSVHGHGWQAALGIERDMHFTPAPLSEVLARHTKTHGWTPTWTPRKESAAQAYERHLAKEANDE